MDGWVTIGTELDTKNLEKEIKDSEKKLQQYEKEAEKLTEQKAKIELDLKPYDDAKQKLIDMQSEYERLTEQAHLAYRSTEEGLQNYLNIHRKIGEISNSMSRLRENISGNNSEYAKNKDKLEEINQKISENTHQQGLLNNKIKEMNQKLSQSKGFDKIKEGIKEANKETGKVIKKIAKWGLAIFGIRSAYMLIRQSISTLSQYNEQLETDVEYIRYALATALQPIIERIINLVKTLLGYINLISKAWFGVDLFANASAKNFKKSVGYAKQLNKQLAGFDEMNVLSDTSSGGGGGGTTPSFDLSSPENGQVPDWLQWILDHKDDIINALIGIAAGLTAMKLGFGGLQSLGIGLIFAGMFEAFTGFRDYLEDPSWENFGKIIEGLGKTILGVGIMTGNIPLIIAGALITGYGLIVKNWEKVQEALGNGFDWLEGKSDWIHEKFGDTIGNVYDIVVDSLKQIVNIFTAQIEAAKMVFDGWIKFFKGVFKGDWKMAWEGIKEVFLGIIHNAVNTAVGIFNLMVNALKTAFNSVVSFFKTIINTILGLFSSLGGKAGEKVATAFKNVINKALDAIEGILNTPIKAVNKLIDTINSVLPVSMGKLNTFSFPRLAKGGIISQPGRGVPLAVGGEGSTSGSREGVIPLTDAQQMALIGEAIGKYVTVNLTNITKLDNRQLAREQKTINAQNDFAYNR